MPEKTCLYDKYLPEEIRATPIAPTRFGFWLSEIGWAHYVFRDRIERRDTEGLYHPGDTHTTAYGGYVASSEILRVMGLGAEAFQPDWAVGPINYFDLYEPGEPRPALSERVISNGPTLEVVSNGVVNRGCVMRITNPVATTHRLMIFGDSFASSQLCHSLALHVSEVVFVHQASFDYDMIERYRPDTIIGEIAERFLIDAPSEGNALAWVLENKLVDDHLSPTEAAQFAKTYPQLEDLYGPAMVRTRAEIGRRFDIA